MGEILCHRRETRRQTEDTNFAPQPGEFPSYSKNPAAVRFSRLNDAAGQEARSGTKEFVILFTGVSQMVTPEPFHPWFRSAALPYD